MEKVFVAIELGPDLTSGFVVEGTPAVDEVVTIQQYDEAGQIVRHTGKVVQILDRFNCDQLEVGA